MVKGDVEDANPLDERGSHGTTNKSVSARTDSRCTQSLESMAYFQSATRVRAVAWQYNL